MKTKIITLITLTALLLGAQHADAKIRRVGYWGTPITNTDYTDLQSAHDAATAGDTILVYPGSWSANYSKKLITIGYGYFVDTSAGGLGTQANPGLQNIRGSLYFGINLYAGASNSVFEGIDGLDIYPYYDETVNNITIRRCNAEIRYNNKPSNNWQILQCYINYLGAYWNGGGFTNLTVNNCYIYNGVCADAISQNGQFNNCVFSYFDFGNGSFIIKNSIFINYHNSDANCVYQYNLFNTDNGSIPSGTGNIGKDGTTMQTNVFVGYSTQGTFSNDGMWVLKAGSPAKGKGEGGIDMGIYGGNNPYKLSGIPRIPAIYKLTAPSTTTSSNPYTITLSVRSNN